MMSVQPSILRRLYDVVALFALLNMLALVGLAAYLFGAGRMDAGKLRQVGRVIRGIPLVPAQPAGASKGAAAQAPPAQAAAPPVESDAEIEMAHREAERIKTELGQRLALSNSILLKVRTEREALEKDREAAKQHDEAAAAVQQDEGFKTQVAIFEALAPKVAVQHLLSIADPDEAAKVLTAMDTAKAKKIVESAKRGDDLTRMKTILLRVREVAPLRLADLNRNEE